MSMRKRSIVNLIAMIKYFILFEKLIEVKLFIQHSVKNCVLIITTAIFMTFEREKMKNELIFLNSKF